MQNAECRSRMQKQNAETECRMQNAECRMQSFLGPLTQGVFVVQTESIPREM